ncbi:enoyl-CoA hydratase [Frondihabitans sucicola]|uniref:Enoyl-CoA hydratase n=1 Tax=Frondihabitans sucicola TaxID=1268041 RepID=A0ABM8GPJ4_9MICO|nr:enoyl-CoA hydratase/isomerase family protein [Frondihabitans sucicola]BDZ50360.1 enoyl-CoA hydratase [Frondihabitans sucicola]
MSTPSWNGLRLDRHEGDVSVLTLDRPERMNAVTHETFRALGEAARVVARDGSRALVLTGAGDRAFSAGYDLAELPGLLQTTVQEFLDIEDTASGAVAAFHALPIPVVAAVNGAAAGGGLSLALAADFRLVADTASFSAAFARVGFSVGELGTSWMLSRLVGPGLAAELSFTGRSVSADEALRIGLADRVLEPGILLSTAIELAQDLADPARDDRIGKRTLTSAGETASFEVALRSRLADRS